MVKKKKKKDGVLDEVDMVKPFIVKNPFKYLAEKWYRFTELAPYASSYFSLHLLNLYVYRVYFLASINMCRLTSR